MSQKVLCGSVSKYVNLGSGWQKRFFVVSDGLLRYYLIGAPQGVEVGHAVAKLKADHGAAMTCIGPQASAGDAAAGFRFPDPRGQVVLQGATVRASGADPKKFYVEAGPKISLKMRAETQEDRDAWVRLLEEAKKQAVPRPQSKAPTGERAAAGGSAAGGPDPEFAKTLSQVKDILWQNGVAEEVVQVIERLLADDHERLWAMVGRRNTAPTSLRDAVQGAGPAGPPGAAPPSAKDSAAPATPEAPPSPAPVPTLARNGSEGGVSSRSGGLEGGEDSDDDLPEIWFEAAEEIAKGAAEDLLNGLATAPPQPPRPPVASPNRDTRGAVGRFASIRRPVLFSSRRPSTASSEDDEGDFGPVDAQGVADSIKRAREGGRALPSPPWLSSEAAPAARRAALPLPRGPTGDPAAPAPPSLWSLIKEAVGRDLTRICLPVYFNEPLSALQKAAEDLEYSDLLDAAATLPKGSLERLLAVTAFAVAPYGSTEGRTCKPFNPLLGETYELVHPEKGFRFIAEKVCHHPPILAANAEGRGWTLEADAELKSKFWGRSVEVIPVGSIRATFADGESFTWSKVSTSINNLILGKLYIDHSGTMRVQSSAGALVAKVRFLEQGVLYKELGRIRGAVVEEAEGGRKVCLLDGRWNQSLSAVFPQAGGAEVEVWRRSTSGPKDASRYNLSGFALALNEIPAGLKGKLPPTDSRLRPDQSALERGESDRANAEKQRLEKKQRAARKAAEGGEAHRPRWFVVDADAAADAKAGGEGGVARPERGRITYHFNGGYWAERQQGWTHPVDIFG